MAHRIREAMRDGGLVAPMGGEGKVVEADETYYGPVEEHRPPSSAAAAPHQERPYRPGRKRAIVSLVERGGNVAPSTSPSRTRRRSAGSSPTTSPAKPAAHGRKQALRNPAPSRSTRR